jgi:hypothetical protein
MSVASLSQEHRVFYEWFQSFWASPSGERVKERFPPDAKVSFTGNPTMSGADYVEYMDGMLAAFPGMLYIAWETSSMIEGKPLKFLGVDRFKIVDGAAVEEQIIFDSAVLTPEGRPGIDD